MNAQQRDPFPIHKSLIDCFEVGVTPEENEFLLKLGDEPYTYEGLAALSDLAEDSFRPFFEAMRRKGLLYPDFSEEGKDQYTLSGIMVGWFEMFLCDGRETPEQQDFARHVEEYFGFLKKMNFFPIRNLQNRNTRKHLTAPRYIASAKKPQSDGKTVQVDINMSLETPEMAVYPTKSVYELIEKYGNENKIALEHCFCREWKKMAGEPCRFKVPQESCIVLGEYARHAVEVGSGHYITKEHALQLILDFQKKGVVHQSFHPKDDIDQPEMAICNCCWDCCGVLGSYSRGILALRIKAYYTARISDAALCTGCGICVKFCPVGAISLDNQVSSLQSEKCIGCGQCELQCPEGVFSLEYTERDVVLPLKKRSEARITQDRS
jgi:ferredoxin